MTINSALLDSCIALVALTAIVWFKLFLDRFGELKSRKLPPGSLSSSFKMAQNLTNVQASDNFKNLLEVPVLFYVLCLALVETHLVTMEFVVGAWIFVFLRVVHSYVHCTYNKARHRALAYLSSSVILFALWGLFAVRLA